MSDDNGSIDRLRALSAPAAILDPDILASVLEILPDGVLIIDEQGIIRFVNSRTEFLFGYPRTDLLGQSVDRLLPDALRDSHAHHRQKFFEDPKIRPMGQGASLKGRRSNGSEIEVMINLAPVMTPQGIYAVAVVRKRHSDAS